MSRFGQFWMAFLAQSSAQRGALWWAAHHRHHHKYSDAPDDVHSPVQRGFWYSHVGWIFSDNSETHTHRIKDLMKFPELVWLDRYHHIPAIVVALASYYLAGLPGLIIGFFLVLLRFGMRHLRSTAYPMYGVLGGMKRPTIVKQPDSCIHYAR